MRSANHLTTGLQHVLRALYTEATLSGPTPAARASVYMLAAGFRSASSATSAQHRQLVHARLQHAHFPATVPMQRQKRTKARASATETVRLPKPALLEFAQQLERCAHASLLPRIGNLCAGIGPFASVPR
jgi:hypothetical protein